MEEQGLPRLLEILGPKTLRFISYTNFEITSSRYLVLASTIIKTSLYFGGVVTVDVPIEVPVPVAGEKLLPGDAPVYGVVGEDESGGTVAAATSLKN